MGHLKLTRAKTIPTPMSYNMNMNYDVWADWQINFFCNFRCEYCFSKSDGRKENPEFNGCSVERITAGFDRTNLVWLLHMSGGEPFLHPKFVELCRRLTRRHFISLNSNISTCNVYEFAEQIGSERVAFVHCSLHFDERVRLGLIEDFIAKYHFLEKRGFNVFATQVLYPPILSRFNRIFKFFLNRGIVIKPKIFRGSYNQRCYPTSYTEAERAKILGFFRFSKDTEWIDIHLVDGNLSFKGLPCGAGSVFVMIGYDGNVTRCTGEPIGLGNVFDGHVLLLEHPEPCHVDICPCPYYGLQYAEVDASRVA